MDLHEILDTIAHRIVAEGTACERDALAILAAAASTARPGAAAALVDGDSPEIARLRAFGIVHGAVLAEIAPGERDRIAAELLSADRFAVAA